MAQCLWQQLIQHLPSLSEDHPLLCLLVDASSKLCFSKKSCPEMCELMKFLWETNLVMADVQSEICIIYRKKSSVSVVLKNQMGENSLWGEKWSALWVMALLGQINGQIRKDLTFCQFLMWTVLRNLFVLVKIFRLYVLTNYCQFLYGSHLSNDWLLLSSLWMCSTMLDLTNMTPLKYIFAYNIFCY